MRTTALLLLLVVGAAPAAGQPDADCATAYETLLAERVVEASGVPVTSCRTLVAVIVTEQSVAAKWQAAALTAPRDVQPLRGATGGASGSAGQAEAVPGLTTEPLAGGSVSAVGTADGAGAIATISLNPLVVTGSLENAAEIAERSRTFDLSLLVPIDDADRDGDGRLDYIGVRGRLDVLGARRGRRVYAEVLRRYEGRLSDVLDDAALVAERTAALLTEADDVTACARALIRGVGDGCSGALVAPSAVLYHELDRAADRVRATADSASLGLDLRFDYGDPTLGAVPGADGVALTALVAGSRALSSGAVNAALRGHAGIYYADRDSMDSARFAFDGALGLVVSQPYGLQQIDVQAGLLGRFSFSDGPTALPTEQNRLLLSGSVNVPLTEMYSASVRVALPVLGETEGSVLSVTGHWHLPLPGRPGF